MGVRSRVKLFGRKKVLLPRGAIRSYVERSGETNVRADKKRPTKHKSWLNMMTERRSVHDESAVRRGMYGMRV
jgi:hypothetical protein